MGGADITTSAGLPYCLTQEETASERNFSIDIPQL